jgi:hypothetical protein
MNALWRYLDRLFGRLVCHKLGSHTADWTMAHMCGGEPLCRFCKRPRTDW